MGPLGFLTGVVLGSAASIGAVLLMVLVIFMLSASDHPSLQQEYWPLTRSAIIFVVLTAVSAAAFYSLQRRLRWRWGAQAAMWAALAVVVWSYWPQPTG
ncbi:MAG: hypothetical protein IT483_03695 [Gammaproteobacteria bacterium]|nr:hypothetical protein [Gammaproteobacteria bacterium]